MILIRNKPLLPLEKHQSTNKFYQQLPNLNDRCMSERVFFNFKRPAALLLNVKITSSIHPTSFKQRSIQLPFGRLPFTPTLFQPAVNITRSTATTPLSSELLEPTFTSAVTIITPSAKLLFTHPCPWLRQKPPRTPFVRVFHPSVSSRKYFQV